MKQIDYNETESKPKVPKECEHRLKMCSLCHYKKKKKNPTNRSKDL
mgnify:CR=1 FL=1